MSWKDTIFQYLSKKTLTSSNFQWGLGSKKYVIEFETGYAVCIPCFITLAQADQILDRGDDSSPQDVIDQKSPGQIGLTRNFQISFMNSLYLFLIFSLSMSICIFEFSWIKPSEFIETKIYVKNGFKAANTTFV